MHQSVSLPDDRITKCRLRKAGRTFELTRPEERGNSRRDGNRGRRRTPFRGRARRPPFNFSWTRCMRIAFRRRPKGWVSLSDYRKLREREMKRDPDCVARELEQASQWSLRVAERKRKESSHRENEKGSLG